MPFAQPADSSDEEDTLGFGQGADEEDPLGFGLDDDVQSNVNQAESIPKKNKADVDVEADQEEGNEAAEAPASADADGNAADGEDSDSADDGLDDIAGDGSTSGEEDGDIGGGEGEENIAGEETSGVDASKDANDAEADQNDKDDNDGNYNRFQAAQDNSYVAATSPRGTPTPEANNAEDDDNSGGESGEEGDAWSVSMKSHRQRMKLLGQSKAAGTISPEEYTKIVEAETQAMEMERELSLAEVKNAKANQDLQGSNMEDREVEGAAGRAGGKKSKKDQQGGKRKKKKRWRRRRKDMKRADIVSTVSSIRMLSVSTQEVNAAIRTDIQDLLF
jgi:hypothetical protein